MQRIPYNVSEMVITMTPVLPCIRILRSIIQFPQLPHCTSTCDIPGRGVWKICTDTQICQFIFLYLINLNDIPIWKCPCFKKSPRSKRYQRIWSHLNPAHKIINNEFITAKLLFKSLRRITCKSRQSFGPSLQQCEVLKKVIFSSWKVKGNQVFPREVTCWVSPGKVPLPWQRHNERGGKKTPPAERPTSPLQASMPCEHVSGTPREEGSSERITGASSGRRRKEEWKV